MQSLSKGFVFVLDSQVTFENTKSLDFREQVLKFKDNTKD